MRRIFISSGHSNNPAKDRGAVANGFVEGVLTVELRRLIANDLTARGATVVVDSDDLVTAETIALFRNQVEEDDILLDLHFNSGPVSASGTETYVSRNPLNFEVKLAQALSKTVGQALGIPVRGAQGVKTEDQSQHPGGLGWMRLNGQNVLLETCFISNPNDMAAYQSKKIQMATALVSVLLTFANEPSNMPVLLW